MRGVWLVLGFEYLIWVGQTEENKKFLDFMAIALGCKVQLPWIMALWKQFIMFVS